MKVSLDYVNPLTQEQEVLQKILTIKNIQFSEVKNKGSYCSAVATLDEHTATGYSEKAGTELQTLLKAQICAAISVLKMSGVEVDFLLSSIENEKTSPSIAIEKVNRDWILACPDVDFALRKLSEIGIDTSNIESYRDELIGKGERLTKNKLAYFMFPHRSNTVILPKQAVAKTRPAIRKEPIKMTDLVTKYTAQRTGYDAELLMASFKEMGIDEKVYNTLPQASKYNSLTLFCLYASEEEVQALIQ